MPSHNTQILTRLSANEKDLLVSGSSCQTVESLTDRGWSFPPPSEH